MEDMSQDGAMRDYHHPFQPYPIQVDFMNAVYDCIQERQVGIFESPTGTGKSLSLICGALTWLREHDAEAFEPVEDVSDEPVWVLEQARKAKQEALLRTRQEFEARLAKVREREQRQKERFEGGEPSRKKSKSAHQVESRQTGDDEASFLLDYESDDERADCKHAQPPGAEGVSSASLELMIKLGMASRPAADDEEELDQPVKIFFCSRTHSQLAQFASELRRVQIPRRSPLRAEVNEADRQDELPEHIKHLSLGSRKTLCINPQVSQLQHQTAVNERCLELQQGKTAEKSKCPFLPNQENQPLVHQFRDHALARVRDIEDLAALGKKVGVCPYYASRSAIKPSEIVTLPYPLLLQKSARVALDLSLKDQIIIVDEAHNLMDTISGIHSTSISLGQLRQARQQVGIYLQKFRNKLKGKNRVYVTQIVRLIDSLAAYLESKATSSAETEGAVSLVDLMAGKGVDQINLHKLAHYLHESKLARKVDGYVALAQESKTDQQQERTAPPVLMQIQSFFLALTSPTSEGRFFHARTEDGGHCLKYLLLDPMYHFKDIVDEARAVILAGGTMSPMDDYTRYLFPYLPSERLRTLSCGHIVPDSHLCAWPLGTGPTGIALDFTFEKRQQPATVAGLGRCVLELAAAIPDGLVVFFPSHAYLEHVATAWQAPATGSGGGGESGSSDGSLWARIAVRKPIFREAQTGSVDEVLRAYGAAIDGGGGGGGPHGRGALLLAVVGGRLSEGINFADRLGRGVAVVGLPFANARGAEWRARLAHVEARQGAAAARAYYENACMRAVNQSVGRAIRHRADYASIVLLDRRYATPRIQGKLPGWIRTAVERNGGGRAFGEATEDMRAFFARMAG